MEKRKIGDVEWGLVWDNCESKARKRIIVDKLKGSACYTVIYGDEDNYMNKNHYGIIGWKHW
jgi:hypothetical protein